MREVGDVLDSGKWHWQVAVGEARVPALAEVGLLTPSRDGAGPAASLGPSQGCIPQKHCKPMGAGGQGKGNFDPGGKLRQSSG